MMFRLAETIELPPIFNLFIFKKEYLFLAINIVCDKIICKKG